MKLNNENLKLYLEWLDEQGVHVWDAKAKTFKGHQLKFCTLHWDSSMQIFDILLDKQFPYLTPYKANEMAKELDNVASICGKLNEHLKDN